MDFSAPGFGSAGFECLEGWGSRFLEIKVSGIELKAALLETHQRLQQEWGWSRVWGLGFLETHGSGYRAQSRSSRHASACSSPLGSRRALPTETKVESGTFQSKRGSSVRFNIRECFFRRLVSGLGFGTSGNIRFRVYNSKADYR